MKKKIVVSTYFLLYVLMIVITRNISAQNILEPYNPDANTVLLMHFDGSLKEESRNSIITSHGLAPSFANNTLPMLDQAVRFDNYAPENQSFLTVQYYDGLSLSEDWTVEFWFLLNSWDKSHNNWAVPIILPSEGWNTNFYLEMPASASTLKYGFHGNNGQVVLWASNNLVSVGNWYHVALINDYKNREMKIILHNNEGAKIEETSLTYDQSTVISTGTQDLRIGAGLAPDNYFDGYIDELRISNCVRKYTEENEVIGFSTLAEFFSVPDSIEYWNKISSFIDGEIKELLAYWERPGLAPLLREGEKIKIKLLDRDELISYSGNPIPAWKCGVYNSDEKTIALSVPQTQQQVKFYGNFESLVKNTLGQLILDLKYRNEIVSPAPQYIMEGFGLYRGGYRADRDSILYALKFLGRAPRKSDISDTSGISNTFKKDLIVTYISAQLLSVLPYQFAHFWISYPRCETLWQHHFLYFYEKEEPERITLRKITGHFDIYCTQKDEKYLNDIANTLETRLLYYSECYDMQIDNRMVLVILPDETAGMYNNICDYYNGGSGWGGDKLDILSPDYFGLEAALDFLIPHEFFHVFHFHMVEYLFSIPAFYFEGLANYMANGAIDPLAKDDNWKITGAFEHYRNHYNKEPNLSDLLNSETDTQYDYYNDPYFFGELFYNYLVPDIATFADLKRFFNANCDYSVFSKSYEEIDAGYIQYLKNIMQLPAKPLNESPADNTANTYVPVTLHWWIGDNVQTLDLYLDTINPPAKLMLNNISRREQYTYSNPEYGTKYFWKLVAKNSYGQTEGDIWSFTTMQERTVRIISPNGGENWETGSVQNIEWESQNIERINLALSTDGGVTSSSLAVNLEAAAGAYQWIVPDKISQDCLITISDKSNSAVKDISDGAFAIVPKTFITLLSPVGGEVWTENSEQKITWNCAGIDKIKIEYVADTTSVQWIVISDSTDANTNEFLWNVPSISSGTCKVRLSCTMDNSITAESDNVFTVIPIVGLSDENNILPDVYMLNQNYPNPFNPVTNIGFAIPENIITRNGASVRITIFDILGREAIALVDGVYRPGFYNVRFDGSKFNSGVYFYRITAGSFTQTNKMILMR